MFQAMFARRAVVLALVICGLALTLAVPLRVYLAQRHEKTQLAAQERQDTAEIRSLGHRLAQQNSPANIEIQGKKQLGLVFPGDITAQVELPSQDQPQTALPAPAQHGSGPWYGRVWNSIAVPTQ